jgi:hypothetical protein
MDRACGAHKTHQKPIPNLSQKKQGKPVTNPAVDSRYHKKGQSDIWYYEQTYSRDIDINLLYIITELGNWIFSLPVNKNEKNDSTWKISKRKGLNEY